MKINSDQNVLEATLDRIRFLYSEFEEVVVSFSGGKDSTALLYCALTVAKEVGRLPLKVFFLDQEGEWQGTVDYIKSVMELPEVQPMWFQIPMTMTNNSSTAERFTWCWKAENKDTWLHEQVPYSYKENKYGRNRFHELFGAIAGVEFADKKMCFLAGVRAEEAPKRAITMSQDATYKWITWGKILNKEKEHYTFYPLYDWSFRDVWHLIQKEGLPYNRVYDKMYQHGVPIKDMRISNLHHETSIQSLLLVQEIEPQTWNKIAAKINGANTIKHIKENSFRCPDELPYMFKSWLEYMEFLAKKLIPDEKYQKVFWRTHKKKMELYYRQPILDDYCKTMIKTILSADWDLTKLKNWEMTPNVNAYKRIIKNPDGTNSQHQWIPTIIQAMKYFTTEEKQRIINHFERKQA